MHTCALDSAGQAQCWGANYDGQLGNGTTSSNSALPIAVSGDRAYTQMGARCALDRGGKAWCWGSNSRGQLGNGTTTNSNVPVAVSGDRVYRQIAMGNGYVCALDGEGKAWCWGWNQYGTLGNGVYGPLTEKSVPVAVSGDRVYTTIATGSSHVCALDTGGKAWCWGNNFSGAYGNGTVGNTNAQSTVPVPGPDEAYLQIKAGSGYTCALDADSKVWCWGANNYGQLGNGSIKSSSVPVAVSGDWP